jgi:nicotinate phosphoribosyltransferase
MQSILDNDLYKFTMLDMVLDMYRDAQVEYKFFNRSDDNEHTNPFSYRVENHYKNWQCNLRATDVELQYLKKLGLSDKCLNFLADWKPMNWLGFDIKVGKHTDGIEGLSYRGTWADLILLEVPLLSMMSQANNSAFTEENKKKHHIKKARRLQRAGIKFAEFGTRRRFSETEQYRVIDALRKFPNFIGTSNLGYARYFNVPAIGTVAHELVMAYGAMYGYEDANYLAHKDFFKFWQNKKPRVTLVDTYTSDFYFKTTKDKWILNSLTQWVRQDSGNPVEWINKYGHRLLSNDCGVIFSDGLTVDSAINIEKHVKRRFPELKRQYAIGTYFTNDMKNQNAPKYVIKLTKLNGKDCVKLSDEAGKETGDLLEVARCKKHITE